jgi:hypothetical protein
VFNNDGNESNERHPSPDKRALMTMLMDLYSRPVPKAKRDDKNTAKEKDGEEDGDEDEDEDGKEEKDEESRGPKGRRTHKSAYEAVQKMGGRSNPPRKSHPSPRLQRACYINAPWLLGPWMPTNDTLRALGIRQH